MKVYAINGITDIYTLIKLYFIHSLINMQILITVQNTTKINYCIAVVYIFILS